MNIERIALIDELEIFIHEPISEFLPRKISEKLRAIECEVENSGVAKRSAESTWTLRPSKTRNPWGGLRFDLPNGDDIFDRKKLSEWLGLSESRISELVKEEALPSFKIGRSRRYKKSDVIAWLQKRRQ